MPQNYGISNIQCLTSAQINAMAGFNGQIVYQTDTDAQAGSSHPWASMFYVYDSSILYWRPLPGTRLQTSLVACSGGDVTGAATIATADMGNYPYPRTALVNYKINGTQITAASVTSVTLSLNGTGMLGANGTSIPTGASDSVAISGMISIPGPGNGVITGLVNRVSGTGAYRLAVDGRFSYLHVTTFA